MNPELDYLFTRRSIRTFKPDDVAADLIHDILEAAMAAPSACAQDPWEFVVIRSPDMRAKLAKGLPHGTMIADSPVGIIVCGDMQRAQGNELSYMLQDCSAAVENLLLAVNTLGLGACWLGVHPLESRITHVRNLLNIPEHVIPIAAIAIGWPDEDQQPRTRYRDEAVHRETW